jgi:hypothetical protein
MAVENKYVDPDLASGLRQDPNKAGGSRSLINPFQAFAVAAADDDGSVYRLGRIASNAIIYEIVIACTAITGGTDWDLGLYEAGAGGAVVDADLFMDGQTLASASRVLDGMSNVSVANLNKRVYELLGLTSDPCKVYDLALTANTVGTVAGNVAVKVLTAQY